MDGEDIAEDSGSAVGRQAGLLEALSALHISQRLDDIAQISCQNPLQCMHCLAYAVIGDPSLGIIVGADLS